MVTRAQEIVAAAFADYAIWQDKWSEDLEEIDNPLELATIYNHMMSGIDIDLAKAMAKIDCQ